jgi:hypothetical protein
MKIATPPMKINDFRGSTASRRSTLASFWAAGSGCEFKLIFYPILSSKFTSKWARNGTRMSNRSTSVRPIWAKSVPGVHF